MSSVEDRLATMRQLLEEVRPDLEDHMSILNHLCLLLAELSEEVELAHLGVYV